MPTREEAYKKLSDTGKYSEDQINSYLDEEFTQKEESERDVAYKKLSDTGKYSEDQINSYLDEEFSTQKKKETTSKSSGDGSGQSESSSQEEFNLFEEAPQEQQEVDRSELDQRFAQDPTLNVDDRASMEVQAAEKAQENRGIAASEQTSQITGGAEEGQEEFMADIEARKQEAIDRDKHLYDSHKGAYDELTIGERLKKDEEEAVYNAKESVVKRNYDKRISQKVIESGIDTNVKGEKSQLSELKDLQKELKNSSDIISNLEHNSFAKTIPKAQEELERLKSKNSEIEQKMLSKVSDLRENRKKDKDWGKTKVEIQNEKIKKELYKDDNKILSALSDKYLSDSTKEGVKDKANVLKWSEDKKKEVLESIDFDAQRYLKNADIDNLWSMEGITDKKEILNKYIHEKMIPNDLTTILSYKMSSRGFFPGSGGGRQDTEAQEILREFGLTPSSDLMNLVNDPDGFEEFKNVTEEEANAALDRLLIADLMANKGVDPTKLFNTGEYGKFESSDLTHVGARGLTGLYEGVKDMMFFGGDQDILSTRSRLSSPSKSGSTSIGVLSESGLGPLEGMSDRAKKTTLESWASGIETVGEIIPVFIGANNLANLGRSGLKGTEVAAKYADRMVKLEQAVVKAKSPMKKAMLSLAVKGERAVTEGVTHQIANWVYDQEDLNIVSGTGGAFVGGLVKSILGKYNPSKKGIETIKNMFSRAMGENVEEITEELIQNDFDLSGMTKDDWIVMLSLSTLMGGAIGGTKKIESDSNKYSDLARIAKSNLSTEEFNKVKSDLGIDTIEEVYSVGQTVDLDAKAKEKTAIDKQTTDVKEIRDKETDGETKGKEESSTETEEIRGLEGDEKKDISKESEAITAKKEEIKPSESKTAEEEKTRMATETKAIEDSRKAELKQKEGKSKTEKGQEALNRDVNERHDQKLAELKESEKVFNKRGHEVKLSKEEIKQDKKTEETNKKNQPIRDLFDKIAWLNDSKNRRKGKDAEEKFDKVLSEANTLANENGFMPLNKKSDRNYGLRKEGHLNKDGKQIYSSKRPFQIVETNKEKAKSYNLLIEESHEVQKDFKKLKENGVLDNYTTGEADANRLDISEIKTERQFQNGMRDIENGIRSFDAQAILDYVNRYNKEGNAPLLTGKGNLEGVHTITKEQIDEGSKEIFKEENLASNVIQEFISSKSDVDLILDPEKTIEGFNDLSPSDQDAIYDTALQLKNKKEAVLSEDGEVYVFNEMDIKKGEEVKPKERKTSETAKKIEKSEVIPQEVLSNLSEEGKKYNVLSDAQATKEAVDYINKFDSSEEAAKVVIKSEESIKSSEYSKLPGKLKIYIKDAIALTLLNEAKVLDNSNDPFKTEKIEAKMDAINDLLILRIAEASGAGQTLQGAKNIVDLMYGDGAYLNMKATSDVQKSVDKGHKTHRPTKNVLKEILNENKNTLSDSEFKDEVLKEAAKIVKKRALQAKKGKPTSPKARKKAQAKLDEAKGELENLFSKVAESYGAKKSVHGEERVSATEIVKQLMPILNKIADSLIKLGYYNFKDWKAKYDNQIDKKFEEELKRATTPEHKSLIKEVHKEAKSKSDEIWEEKKGAAKLKKEEYARFEQEKALLNEIKNENKKLEDIVARHYTDVKNTKDSLIQKIIEDLDIEPEEATQIAKSLSKKFTEIANKKKQKLIEKKLGDKKKTQSKSKKELYDNIIELSNLGALSENDLDGALNKYLLIDTVDSDVRLELNNLADKVQQAKGENARREAIYDVTDYMNKLQGLDKTNMILSGMLGGLFAGPSTQALNVKSNFWTGFYEPLIHALSKLSLKKSSPKDMMNTLTKMTHTWWKNLPKGIAEAEHIIRSGKIVHKGVVGQSARILEVMRQLPFEQLKQNAFSKGLQDTPVLSIIPTIETALMKTSAYTGSTAFRALGAMDAVFTMGGETSFRAAELQLEYNKLVERNPNSKNAEIIKEMIEHMHPSNEVFNELKNKGGEAYKDIKKQYFDKNRNNEAKNPEIEEKRLEELWNDLVESNHGVDLRKRNRKASITNNIKRRAWEILNEKVVKIEEDISSEDVKNRIELSKKLATDLSDYAAFVGKPLGAAGMLAKTVNFLLNQAPALKVYIPVVNTVTNVLNKQLDATPIGALSVLNAKLGVSKGDTKKFYSENSKNILARSAIGTAQIVGIFALFARFGTEEDDDESNLFEKLTGFKVKIHGSGPEGWDKKTGMQDKGWSPYSIQIGDKYFSYTTSPFAAGFTALGNFNDRQRYEGVAQDDAENRDRLIDSFLAWNQLMAEGSSVNTTKDLLAAFSKELKSDNKTEIKIMKSVSKTLGMFLPGGNFTRQMGKFVDSGEQVDRNSWKGALAYIVPGTHHLINGVGVQLAWDGTPVKNYPGVKQWWTTADEEVDKSLLETQIEYSPTRRTDIIFKTDEGESILLGADEDMYFDYAKYRGKRLREISEEYLTEIQELDLSTSEGKKDRDDLRSQIQQEATIDAKDFIATEYDLTDFN